VLRRLKAEGLGEGGRGPAAAAVAPFYRFYRGDATAVGHVASVSGAVGHDARIPAAVGHGGSNLAPPGSRADRCQHP
jgi:hypothetical protein